MNTTNSIGQAIASRVAAGMAIDLKDHERTPDGFYVLKTFEPDRDYADSSRESWIWSIGMHKEDGRILAALDSSFYGNTEWRCLFRR